MLDKNQWLAIGLLSGFAYILGKDRESFGAEECSHIFGESAYQDATCSRCGKENEVYVEDDSDITICSCGNRMNGYMGIGIDSNRPMRGKSVCERCGVYDAESFEAYAHKGLIKLYGISGDAKIQSTVERILADINEGQGFADDEYYYLTEEERDEAYDDMEFDAESVAIDHENCGMGPSDCIECGEDACVDCDTYCDNCEQTIHKNCIKQHGDDCLGAESFGAETPCSVMVWKDGALTECGWWNEKNEPCVYHPDGKEINAESFE